VFEHSIVAGAAPALLVMATAPSRTRRMRDGSRPVDRA